MRSDSSTAIASWKVALGTTSTARFKSFPALNHLFMAGVGPSAPAEYQKPGAVDVDVIATITDWILSLE